MTRPPRRWPALSDADLRIFLVIVAGLVAVVGGLCLGVILSAG